MEAEPTIIGSFAGSRKERGVGLSKTMHKQRGGILQQQKDDNAKFCLKEKGNKGRSTYSKEGQREVLLGKRMFIMRNRGGDPRRISKRKGN